ncbi:MAG TPA: FliH/SctL family protein [Candidatus Binatia bacterium]|nr:FliH/SctL family protein [Candidatus Binatia bacterium]
MVDEFVSLAEYLSPSVCETPPPPAPEEYPAAPQMGARDELRAAKLFRAALADALDVAVAVLLRRIARDVLARELQLERPDVAAIVNAALERFSDEKELTVRAHPADLALLSHVEIERISDPSLRCGDVLIELRSGTIDLSLAARLEEALAAWPAPT